MQKSKNWNRNIRNFLQSDDSLTAGWLPSIKSVLKPSIFFSMFIYQLAIIRVYIDYDRIVGVLYGVNIFFAQRATSFKKWPLAYSFWTNWSNLIYIFGRGQIMRIKLEQNGTCMAATWKFVFFYNFVEGWSFPWQISPFRDHGCVGPWSSILYGLVHIVIEVVWSLNFWGNLQPALALRKLYATLSSTSPYWVTAMSIWCPEINE